jgi:hypothetical protein
MDDTNALPKEKSGWMRMLRREAKSIPAHIAL